MSVTKTPVLSISMLVSNGRTETIKKCMDSLVSLRAAVACELVLVDTGCTDGSIEIAREYADRIISFSWCDDFAAARNAGLRVCSGEWFLYLDDDEWFEDTGEIERFFVSGEYKDYDGAWYLVRNYDNYEGTKYTDMFVGRMVRLTKKSIFLGKIHEYLSPVPEKVKRFQSFVHHYGYVYRNEEERQEHLLRNLHLLEEIVAKEPDNIRMNCQLVQEYRAAGRLTEAEALCKKILEQKPYPDANPYMQYLLTCLPRIYTEQGRPLDALEKYEELEQAGRVTFLARLLCSYEKLCIYDKLGENEEFLLQAEEFLKLRDVNPEKEDYPVMDFATYTSDMIYQRAAENGIKGMLRVNDFQKAEFFFDRLDWNSETISRTELINALLIIYQATGNQGLLLKEAEEISAVEALWQIWMTELENFLKVYAGVASEENGVLTRELFLAKARIYMETAKTSPIVIPVLRAWLKVAERVL